MKYSLTLVLAATAAVEKLSWTSPNNGEFQQHFYNFPKKISGIESVKLTGPGSSCYAHGHGSYTPSFELFLCNRPSLYGSAGSTDWETTAVGNGGVHGSYVATKWQVSGCTKAYTKTISGSYYIRNTDTIQSAKFTPVDATTVVVRTSHSTKWSFHSCAGTWNMEATTTPEQIKKVSFTSPNNGEFQQFYYNLPTALTNVKSFTMKGPGSSCYAHGHGSYTPSFEVWVCNRASLVGSANAAYSTTSISGSQSNRVHQSYAGTGYDTTGCTKAYTATVSGNYYVRNTDTFNSVGFSMASANSVIVRTTHQTQWSFHSCAGTWNFDFKTSASTPCAAVPAVEQTSSVSWTSPNNGEFMQHFYNFPKTYTGVTAIKLKGPGSNCYAHPHGSYSPKFQVYLCNRASLFGSKGSTDWVTTAVGNGAAHGSYAGTKWQVSGCTKAYETTISGSYYIRNTDTISSAKFAPVDATTVLVRTSYSTKWSFHSCAGTWNMDLTHGGKANTPCVTCKAGTILKDGKCESCVAGKFSRMTNSLVCLSCLPGRYGTTAGMAICDQCAAGTYGDHKYSDNKDAHTSCTTCPSGKFSGVAGMAFCGKCMLGTYAPNTGSTACTTCPAGLHGKVVQTAAQEKALNGASPQALVAKVAVSPSQAKKALQDKMLNIFGKQGLFADMDPLYYLYRFSGEPTTNENMATYPNCCYESAAAKTATSTQTNEWANIVMHEGMELPDGFTQAIDKDFIRGMIPHHQGAVDMAKIQKCHGSEASLKKFNEWIIGHQKFEIDWQMKWMAKNDNAPKATTAQTTRAAQNPCTTTGGLSAAAKMTKMMGMMTAMKAGCLVNNVDRCHSSIESNIELLKNDASKSSKLGHIINSQMHCGMMIQFTGKADQDYVRGMIPHHKGAVDMCKVVLKFGTDPDVKTFCTDVIGHQATEIEWMKQWLSRNTPLNSCAKKCPIHNKLADYSVSNTGNCVNCELGTHDPNENTRQFCLDTSSPTAFPTAHPTAYPTAFPTAHPTAYPTAFPTAHPTAYPTAFPTAFPTPAPTGILSHQACKKTTCTFTMTNGKAMTKVESYRSSGEKWHCEKVGAKCKCVCHSSLSCNLRHHHETGYKKTFSHC